MSNSERPRVVIIGGGFAGLAAARSLKSVDAEIFLIDRQNHHLFQPLLYQVATAALHPGNIAAPIRTILRKQSNTTVLMKEVNGIDVTAQKIMLGGVPYMFDYLVLATGFETNYFGNEPWKKHAPGLKTIREAVDIRGRFLLAFEQAEFEEDSQAKQAALTFAIVGAGPTGVEMAGALAEIATSIHKDFRWFDAKTARIILIDFADRVLSSFHTELSIQAEHDLKSMGVEVLLNTRVITVDESGLSAQTPEGQVRIDANNVIWAAGVKGSPLALDLNTPCDGAGRVMVNADLSIPDHTNIFVAGDLAHVRDDNTGEPVPAIAQGAIQGGAFVGETIAAEITAARTGRPVPARKRFTYNDRGSMAIIGRNRAIAQIGRFRLSGYPAFLLWALIHILFLIGFRRKAVVFIEWVWLYFTGGRGTRLITGEDKIPKIIKPPPDSR